MAIEVKQLVVKSTVDKGGDKKAKAGDPCYDMEQVKREILAECRDLFVELLQEHKER